MHAEPLDPPRVIQLEYGFSQFLVEDRDQVNPRGEEILEMGVKRTCKTCRQFVHGEPGNVHRCCRRFHIQESCIHTAQLLHNISPFLRGNISVSKFSPVDNAWQLFGLLLAYN